MFSDYAIHLAAIYGSIGGAILICGLLLYFAFGVKVPPDNSEIKDDKLYVHGIDALAYEHLKAVARLQKRELVTATTTNIQLRNVAEMYDIDRVTVDLVYRRVLNEIGYVKR